MVTPSPPPAAAPALQCPCLCSTRHVNCMVSGHALMDAATHTPLDSAAWPLEPYSAAPPLEPLEPYRTSLDHTLQPPNGGAHNDQVAGHIYDRVAGHIYACANRIQLVTAILPAPPKQRVIRASARVECGVTACSAIRSPHYCYAALLHVPRSSARLAAEQLRVYPIAHPPSGAGTYGGIYIVRYTRPAHSSLASRMLGQHIFGPLSTASDADDVTSGTTGTPTSSQGRLFTRAECYGIAAAAEPYGQHCHGFTLCRMCRSNRSTA